MVFQIYLITPGGRNLLSYREENNKDDHTCEDHLISGIVFVITKAIKCIAKTEQNVRTVDIGEIKLHFEYGVETLGLLITNSDEKELKIKFKLFISRFEREFESHLNCWNGNQSIFQGAREMVEEIFQ